MATDLAETLQQFADAVKPASPPTQPNSVAEIRSSRTPLVRLPSGNVYRLKRIGIFDVIELGQVPQTLSTEAAQVAGPGLKTMTEADIKKYIGVVNVVACACSLDPKVVMRPEEGAPLLEDALYADEVPFIDREAIFKWGCGLASSLQPFRPESVVAVQTPPAE